MSEWIEREDPPGSPAALEPRPAAAVQRLMLLLSAPPERRWEMARSEGFRDLDLAHLLLEKAVAAQSQDVVLAEELARLALVIAERFEEDRWVEWTDTVKARACTVLGNLLRLEQDWDGAEALFRDAAFLLTGPPDSRERAFYCQNLARLREEQGETEEAAALLWRAARIYREKGVRREEGLCLAQLGFLHLEEERLERAVPPLTRACQTLEARVDAVCYVHCSLALAWCHASLGESEKSVSFLEVARSLYPWLPADEPLIHVLGFEGKMAALAGIRYAAVELEALLADRLYA